MASIGGVLMQGGLINGYSIAAVAAQAANAASLAQSAYSQATTANTTANNALHRANNHMHGAGTYYVVDPESGTLGVGGVSGSPT